MQSLLCHSHFEEGSHCHSPSFLFLALGHHFLLQQNPNSNFRDSDLYLVVAEMLHKLSACKRLCPFPLSPRCWQKSNWQKVKAINEPLTTAEGRTQRDPHFSAGHVHRQTAVGSTDSPSLQKRKTWGSSRLSCPAWKVCTNFSTCPTGIFWK